VKEEQNMYAYNNNSNNLINNEITLLVTDKISKFHSI